MGDIYFPNLGISIEKLSRTAFSFLGMDIYWYGILIATGVALGMLAAVKEAERTGQSKDTYIDFLIYGIISGVVGARLYYLIFHDGSIKEFFLIRNGGLAVYGGVIGGIAAILIFTRVKKLSMLKFTDTCAMSMLIGQIIGRWGNFVNREAFGRATNSILAMAYNVETVGGLVLQDDGSALYNKSIYPVYEYGGIKYIQVHPTFLYESFLNLCLLVFIFFFRKHKRFDGELTFIYFMGYGIIRFFVESLRTDQLLIFGVPVSMIVSAFVVAASLVCEIFFLKKIKKV